jgi:AbrB family looped-hinge helix DNA binding protein
VLAHQPSAAASPSGQRTICLNCRLRLTVICCLQRQRRSTDPSCFSCERVEGGLGKREPSRLALPGNTCLVSTVDASSSCSITSKGQVTIPKALRQQLGLGRGSRVCFELVGDHLELRPWKPQQTLPASGFGLLKSRRPPVPVEFDPASLLRP